MGTWFGPRMGRWINAIARDENLDLHALIVAGLVFTMLGILGIADSRTLAAMILGFLAVLAFSQLRSRRQFESLTDSVAKQRTDLFLDHFPPDLAATRATAHRLTIVGVSAHLVLQAARGDILRILQRKGTVRVLLLDPSLDALVISAELHDVKTLPSGGLRLRIQQSLDQLAHLQAVGGTLEVRLASFVPRTGMVAMEAGDGRTTLLIQYYEHRSDADSIPVIRLDDRDGRWFQHFASDLERIWDSGHAPTASP